MYRTAPSRYLLRCASSVSEMEPRARKGNQDVLYNHLDQMNAIF